MSSQYDEDRAIERRNRQARVERMRVLGYNQRQIAVRLGVSEPTISIDVKEIDEKWRAETEEIDAYRMLSIACLSHMLTEEFNAWERSKGNAEEVSTVYTPRACGECEDGLVGDSWCEACGGTGQVLTEVTTRRSKGQSGDAVHMKVALEIRKEIDRLRGLGERKGGGPDDRKRRVLRGRLQDGLRTEKIDWSRVPPERLLEVRALLTKIKAELRPAIEVDRGGE